jgi:hypothetical protein
MSIPLPKEGFDWGALGKKVGKGLTDGMQGWNQAQQGGIQPMGPQGPQQGMIFGKPQAAAPQIMPYQPQDYMRRVQMNPLMSKLRLTAPDLTGGLY